MIAKRMILAFIVAPIVASPMTVTRAAHNEDVASAKARKVSTNAKMKVLTGSWIGSMPPFKSLITFTEDGGLVTTGAFIVPFPPPIGRAVFSAGQGEWDKIRNREFSFTLVALIHDENAILLGTSKVTGTINVDETMDSFSGTAHAADLDPNGNATFCFGASIQGKRIRAGY